MTYEIWQTDDVWIICPVEDQAERAYLEQTSTLMWSVEASSYEEALELYDDYLSLEITEDAICE